MNFPLSANNTIVIIGLMNDLIVRLDTVLSDYVQRLPSGFQPLMSGITHLGDPLVILTTALVGSMVALRQNQQRAATAISLVLILSAASFVLKQLLQRDRPDTIYVTAMNFKSYSFPSFHAYSSTVLYGLLAYFAFKYLPRPWGMVTGFGLGALVALVGISRVYLGAHYPTDVIGGWILGLFSLLLIIMLILRRA